MWRERSTAGFSPHELICEVKFIKDRPCSLENSNNFPFDLYEFSILWLLFKAPGYFFCHPGGNSPPLATFFFNPGGNAFFFLAFFSLTPFSLSF